MKKLHISWILSAVMLMVSCANKNVATPAPETEDTAEAPTATFDADSAYAAIEAQVAFGPRVPGTRASDACADYLAATLRQRGADSVWVQRGSATAFNGDVIPIKNVLARYNSQAPKRVLLLAHWDSRPWADNDPDPANHSKPIDGANDGASGVAVILEIARLLGQTQPQVGVDILLCDAEDYGKTAEDEDTEATWCLGTRLWADSNPYAQTTAPDYGVLLDMVGGKNARFPQEYFSTQYARSIVDKVWAMGQAAGYGDRFTRSLGGAITDDHIIVNNIGIPCIDIIEIDNPATGSFNPTWHTLDDNVANIDKATLKAVGQTVTNVIYNE